MRHSAGQAKRSARNHAAGQEGLRLRRRRRHGAGPSGRAPAREKRSPRRAATAPRGSHRAQCRAASPAAPDRPRRCPCAARRPRAAPIAPSGRHSSRACRRPPRWRCARRAPPLRRRRAASRFIGSGQAPRHQRVAAEDLSGVPPAALERDIVDVHQRMDHVGEAEVARGAVEGVGQQVPDAGARARIGLQDRGPRLPALQPVRQAEQEADQAVRRRARTAPGADRSPAARARRAARNAVLGRSA